MSPLTFTVWRPIKTIKIGAAASGRRIYKGGGALRAPPPFVDSYFYCFPSSRDELFLAGVGIFMFILAFCNGFWWFDGELFVIYTGFWWIWSFVARKGCKLTGKVGLLTVKVWVQSVKVRGTYFIRKYGDNMWMSIKTTQMEDVPLGYLSQLTKNKTYKTY